MMRTLTKKQTSPWVGIGFILGLVGTTRADFDLPVLNPVSKIVSMPHDIEVSQLKSFLAVRDLILEIRLGNQNNLPEHLYQFLNLSCAHTPKRLVLGSALSKGNLRRFRGLTQLEVQYQVGISGLDSKSILRFYELGPIRKFMVLPSAFNKQTLGSVGKLKYYTLVVQKDSGSLTEEQFDQLMKDRTHPKKFVIPYDFPPEKLYDLIGLAPLNLEVETRNNRIADHLFGVLKDLKKTKIIVVVDGKLTLASARQWSRLDRFSLKIRLETGENTIPGLIQLLNRITPPALRK